MNWLHMSKRTSNINISDGKYKFKNKNEEEAPSACCPRVIFYLCAMSLVSSKGTVEESQF